jgi:hypothetical protein
MGNTPAGCCSPEQHQDPFVPRGIDSFVLNGVADRRVEVQMGELEIVADVPTTSLAAFRASLLKQLEDAEAGCDLSGGSHPVVIKYKSLDGSGKWLALSSAGVKDFASCQDKSQKIAITVTRLDHHDRGPPLGQQPDALPRGTRTNSLPFFPSASPGQEEGDDREVWGKVVRAAESMRSGENQVESVAVLTQIFAQVNASMDFPVVHGIRWRLSDEAVLTQILQMFNTNSQLLIQAYADDADVGQADSEQRGKLENAVVCLEHSSALLELLSFKGSEAQIHAGLRKDNVRNILVSSFIDDTLQLGRLLMEQHALSTNVLFMSIDHAFKCLRFLLTDGEADDWPSKPARIRLMHSGFVQELLRVFALDYSDTFVPLKDYYLNVLVELSKDSEHIGELGAKEVTDELLKILRLGMEPKFRRMKLCAQLVMCQVVDEKVLETLDDDIAEIVHVLTSSVEKKIKGKFVFYSLRHILVVILKLSASNENKRRFSNMMGSLIFILKEPYKPLHDFIAANLRQAPSAQELETAAKYGMPEHVLLAARRNDDVQPTRINTLLTQQVKRLAAEILLSLIFFESNAFLVTSNQGWISQLRVLSTDPEYSFMRRELLGIFMKLSLKKHAIDQKGGYSKPAESNAANGGASPRKKLMISYCWTQQDMIKEVYQCLQDEGFDVWLDIHKMAAGSREGGVLDAMSKAIDEAEVVLVAVSREYKDSANCRLEAEYAHVRKKRMVFMMMQEDFTTPSGWLGMLVGSKLWHPLFDDSEPTAAKVEDLKASLC